MQLRLLRSFHMWLWSCFEAWGPAGERLAQHLTDSEEGLWLLPEFVVLPKQGPSSGQRDRGGGAVPVEQLCGKDEVILVPAALFSCG